MRRVRQNRWGMGLLALLLCIALPAFAAPAPGPQAVARGPLPQLDEGADLEQLNDRLEFIRQSVSASGNDDLLSDLRQAALQVQKQADSLAALRATDIERLDDQLKVLGPPKPDEAQSLSNQRQVLAAQKDGLLEDERQANLLSQSGRDLAAQIINLRRSLFNSQISTRSASPSARPSGRR